MVMAAPILRWTIGPSSHAGFKALLRSVRLIKKIYPNFELYICHNGLNTYEQNFLKGFRVNLIQQTNGLNCSPSGVAWKLYPPRIDMTRHEIFVDNDLILHKPLEEIDWFLEQSNSFIVTEGLGRVFGNKESLIPKNLRINSGLFGIPPNFDFAQKINELSKGSCWEDCFNEQGTVAAIVCQNDYKIIPLKTVAICNEGRFKPGTHGTHFCGLNKGLFESWNKYLTYMAYKAL